MRRVFGYQNGKIILTWDELFSKNAHQKSRYAAAGVSQNMDSSGIDGIHQIEYNIIKKTTKMTAAFEIGVELEAHTGGRICYGLLAAKVSPHDERDTVKTTVVFTNENTIRYGDSCLLNDFYVYKGLPEEYVTQVRKGLAAAVEEEDDYPQCEILVDSAANCEVGSSPALFGIIAKMLAKLIHVDSMEEVIDMKPEVFAAKFAGKAPLWYSHESV